MDLLLLLHREQVTLFFTAPFHLLHLFDSVYLIAHAKVEVENQTGILHSVRKGGQVGGINPTRPKGKPSGDLNKNYTC